jgi:hypothetical protein
VTLNTAAVRKLVTTVPTTIYGVLALVQYVQECTRR